MQYRTLGNSDLEVSVITFGAWAAGGWMWGGNDDREAIDAMRAAYDLGVTSIDTAPIYGQGKSEELVGQAIKDLPRDKVQILNKFGMRWDLAKGTFGFKSKDNSGNDIDIYKYAAKESIIEECENSLKRLGTDYIDLYQTHWDDITVPVEETLETYSELVKAGKVRWIGASNLSPERLTKSLQSSEANGFPSYQTFQPEYNLYERAGFEKELEQICLDNNLGVMNYYSLASGLLTANTEAKQT